MSRRKRGMRGGERASGQVDRSVRGAVAVLRELAEVIKALTRMLEVLKPYLTFLLVLWT